MANPPRPIGAGDQFTYSGAYLQTFAESSPCPQPTATTSATITQTVSDSATTAPGGGSASDQKTVETDVFPTQTTSQTTDQVLANTGAQLLLYSVATNDGSGNTMTTSYTNPQQIDQLPEAPGNAWSNGPAAKIQETLADGTSIARSVASDGSYVDTETYANGGTSNITVNGSAPGTALDGSGSYDLNAGAQCNGEVDFSYSAPSGNAITETVTGYAISNNVCQQVTKTRTYPAWFTVPSASYITDTFSDNGSAALPGSCSPGAGVPTTAEAVVETYSVLDPVLGYTETRTTTSYDAPGYGPVCVTIADTLNGYYDYLDNTYRIDYQSQNGKPLFVDTITETLNMQGATCSGGPPCTAARHREAGVISPAAVTTGVASIEHVRALQIARRLDALHSFAMHLAHRGAQR
jgi:hypothetical protein